MHVNEREREVVTAMMCSTPLRFPILPYPGSRRCVCVCVCVCVSAFTLYSLILEEKQTENYYLICGSLKKVRQFFIKLKVYFIH